MLNPEAGGLSMARPIHGKQALLVYLKQNRR
jgi:hypothetical protein